jgi:predicted hotdog family 3-hydroxylacyl-ACP dehydratase
VLRGGALPIKSRAMRGVALGQPWGDDPAWVREAARVVLPGLRIAGEGQVPDESVIELMAATGGVWVGTPRR